MTSCEITDPNEFYSTMQAPGSGVCYNPTMRALFSWLDTTA